MFAQQVESYQPMPATLAPKLQQVTSADGTVIGFRQLGAGPGVLMIHGSMESSSSHLELAEAIADRFTVSLVDRRGRGMSGRFGDSYSMTTEVEDVAAVLAATGATRLFGVSSGGLIALQSALDLTGIERLALFEPAMVINRSISTAFVSKYDREIAEGRTSAALVTSMKGTQMGPGFLARIPDRLLRGMTESMMKSESKKAALDAVTMAKLAPTLHYDFALVTELADQSERFRAIDVPTLLLSGTASPAYLRTATRVLGETIPGAARVDFPKLGHGASGPSNQGGKPSLVAAALAEFFA